MSLTDIPEQTSDNTKRESSPSPRSGRGLVVVAGAVALALGAGYFIVHWNKSEAEARLAAGTKLEAAELPRVDVVIAEAAPATQSLVLPGETAAWYDSRIYARVNGYVHKWYVDIGDRVTNGQTLATIDTPELDAELVAAKAKLNVAVAGVAVKQAKLDFARTTYERWNESPKGVVSEQEREDKKAANAEAAAELAAARAQVLLDQAEVERLTSLTNFKQVQAPFDGTITERQIDLGDLVTAGSTANTSLLYKLTKDDPIRVFVPVPQRAAAQAMKVGTPAVVTANDLPDQQFEGKVTRSSKAINPRARTLRVEIDLPNSNHVLVPGSYVKVSFDLKSSGLVQVPAAALLFRSGGPQVAVVGQNGVVDIRNVAIARDDGNVVEIASGLAVGNKVALNLSSQITAGDKVKIREAGQKALAASTP